ncbi:MAG: N-acetylmuramoyl-L-alanine amidase [Simkaniaceae bacterium]|nr:N-acetylmuramoyl-L-alanine amidase [Simkaniaceae bacterium]
MSKDCENRAKKCTKSRLFPLFFLLIALMTGCSHQNPDAYTAIKAASRPKLEPKVEFTLPEEIHAKPLIVIDPGHGDYDHGAEYFKSQEKQLNLVTAKLVKKHLNNLGYRVLLTRNSDTFVSLIERASIANQSGCSLFVSIHYNSAKNRNVTGIEVFYYPKGDVKRQNASKKLASHVIDHVVEMTGAKSRGIKNGNFCVIRETKMPAILIEGGFMTNPKEIRLLKDLKYLNKVAKGVASGIDRYFKKNPAINAG